MNLKLFALAAAALLPLAVSAQQDFMQESPEAKAGRMKWFADARFGMFIHWGVYSVPAGEYKDQKNHAEWYLETTKMPVSEYEKFADQFNPVKFDARQWVRVAKGAGMKYIVITSKHHDGFGLWDSQLTDWDIGRTPFKRDPLKELAEACKKEDIVFCLYHSIMDWHHPDWGVRRKHNDLATGTPDMDRYDAYLKGQLKELLTNYGRIGILWFDGQWEAPWTTERGVSLYNYCRSLQPNVIINNRVGKPQHTAGGGMANVGEVGDYGTPEQTIPGKAPTTPWESCMTLNGNWGYNKFDQNWKSTTSLIRNLIDCASKGGNYLLNVGPTAEGVIPFQSVVRLQQIGRWMDQNGTAIFGTKPGPFANLPYGRCTMRDRTLFVHVFDVPTDRALPLAGLQTKVKKAYLLADPKKTELEVADSANGPVVTLPLYPNAPWNEHANVVVVELAGDAVVENRILPATDGSFTLHARDAEVEGGGGAHYEAGEGKDNIGYWSDTKSEVVWNVALPAAGRYTLILKAAVKTGSGGTFVATVGDAKLQGNAAETGEWTTFKDQTVGTVEVAKAGPVRIALKADSITGEGIMNLQAVRLVPAK